MAMETKSTSRLNESIVEKAKEYARSRNMSLSKMKEQYLDSTPDEFLKSSY